MRYILPTVCVNEIKQNMPRLISRAKLVDLTQLKMTANSARER